MELYIVIICNKVVYFDVYIWQMTSPKVIVELDQTTCSHVHSRKCREVRIAKHFPAKGHKLKIEPFSRLKRETVTHCGPMIFQYGVDICQLLSLKCDCDFFVSTRVDNQLSKV